ncbi:hypothetical protein KP509_01G115200 [Ceratopteris richardii]|nr:hypothetical protein KP509_01G115200 [Ceratopteris richardii]
MQHAGFTPDAYTFASVLKACGLLGSLDMGQEVHAQIVRHHFPIKETVVGNALVDMYSKCGTLLKAQEVFDKLSTRDVVTWNGLIDGYAEHGHGERALHCFEQMQADGLSPNGVTFTCALKACSSIRNLRKGQEIHDQLVRACLLGEHLAATNALICMYAKCGAIQKARDVFDTMPICNIASWTALIVGYSEHGPAEGALSIFEQMQVKGFSPDLVAFSCVLKACGITGNLDKGQEVHAQIARAQLSESQSFIGNALIDMYCKCGALEKAQEVFHLLPFPDLVSWNTLIGGFAEHEYNDDAFSHFENMLQRSFCPNEFTFSSILKCCASICFLYKGLQFHACMIVSCMHKECIVISGALVDIYASCGEHFHAQKVFSGIPNQDIVIWNILISGYAQSGCSLEVLQSFKEMEHQRISPDAVTLACVLKACGSMGAISKGQETHMRIVKYGLFEEYVLVGNTLIDMYGNFHMLSEAHEVFDKLPERDIVSWNALIACHVENEYYEQALSCYQWMQDEGYFPDAITFACASKACAGIGFGCKGQHIHAEVVKFGYFARGLSIDSGLLTAYASCGMLLEMWDTFDNMVIQDVVAWSVVMVGHAQNGNDEMVFFILNMMLRQGIEPDPAILTIVLYACSHGGLLDEGLKLFDAASKELLHTREHYACIIDMFCRIGRLDKAVLLIEEIPLLVNPALWHTLLGACNKWTHEQLGRWAFEHAVQMNKDDGAAYVCLSNIFVTTSNRHDLSMCAISQES